MLKIFLICFGALLHVIGFAHFLYSKRSGFSYSGHETVWFEGSFLSHVFHFILWIGGGLLVLGLF